MDVAQADTAFGRGCVLNLAAKGFDNLAATVVSAGAPIAGTLSITLIVMPGTACFCFGTGEQRFSNAISLRISGGDLF
jgi:hypothetical protein